MHGFFHAPGSRPCQWRASRGLEARRTCGIYHSGWPGGPERLASRASRPRMAGLEAGRARGLYHSRVPTEPRVAGFADHRTCGIYRTGGFEAQSCGPQLPTLKTWLPHLSAACRLGKWFCMSANPWPSGRQPLPNGSACLLTQKKHDAVHAALHHVSVTW